MRPGNIIVVFALFLPFILAQARAAEPAATQRAGITVYVSPIGNDANPGTKDRPLATLEAARDSIRKASNANAPAARDAVKILLLPGEYFLTKTIEFDARDSGLTIEAADASQKTVLFGGTPVTGWRADGDKFFAADLVEVKDGAWDFRALVVNGRLAPRARWPETGVLLHKSVFDVRWLSSVGGGWERKPREDELATMLYDPKDLPATLEPRNAEVRVYHMWDESLCGVSKNDLERHALSLTPPAKSPPGAFGVKKYVVFNTREGMTQPGQWYLDRAAGRVVYWPLPGEDMSKARVVAPRVERIIRIGSAGGSVGAPAGPATRPVAQNSKSPAERITLRGFSMQATTTPLKSGGFGAYAFDGALHIERIRDCTFEKLEICNVGGQGIAARELLDSRITDCHIHDIGACGIKADGMGTLIARNHVHHVGAHYPSAVAISASNYRWRNDEKGFHLLRNEIHDTPYTGIIGSGGGHLIEENLISRVMRELHDGGAIYGGMSKCILRGNVVRDVVKIGEGYGVSSYYLDEGAQDCIVERNVSIGVERPTHNHIARNLIIRNNVFVAEQNMTLSFQRSGRIAFEGNTLLAPGKININQPSAITSWKGNVMFRSAAIPGAPAGTVAGKEPPAGAQVSPQAFTIDDAMPTSPRPGRRNAVMNVARVSTSPSIDGEVGPDEWPGTNQGLDREPSRDPGSGAPAFIKTCYDDRCLYITVTVATFEPVKISSAATAPAAAAHWGKDDGAEICIAGQTPNGKPVTFVIRGYASGVLASITDAGAPADAAEKLGKSVKFAARTFGKTRGGWRGEWAISWDALGLKPSATAQKIPFNVGIYRTEDQTHRSWEGTLGENWRLDQAGVMVLK